MWFRITNFRSENNFTMKQILFILTLFLGIQSTSLSQIYELSDIFRCATFIRSEVVDDSFKPLTFEYNVQAKHLKLFDRYQGDLLMLHQYTGVLRAGDYNFEVYESPFENSYVVLFITEEHVLISLNNIDKRRVDTWLVGPELGKQDMGVLTDLMTKALIEYLITPEKRI